MGCGRNIVLFAVLALVITGTVCMGLRFQARRDLRMGLADSVWRLTYSIEGEAQRPGAELRVAIPSDTRYCRVFRQDFRHSNLRMDLSRASVTGTREVVGLAEEPDECELTFRFDLHLSPQANWAVDEQPVSLTANAKETYLASERQIQVGGRSVMDTLQRLRDVRMSHSELIQRVFQHCREYLVTGDRDAPSDAEGALHSGWATPLGRTRAMTALCRAGGIPARLVTGFEIKEGDRATPHVWLEALSDGRWLPYDPNRGPSRELPPNILPIRYGGARISLARKMADVESEFSMVLLPGVPQRTGTGRSSLLAVLDLTRLPLELQPVLSLILLMPLGALVTCIFRNVIGIETSGTFTPTLLALSFVFADWRTGLVVLVAVVILGCATRNLLDRLKLLLLPRLSIILTLVVFCIVFAVSLLDYFRLTPGVEAVLLPMVILTMIVERFYVTTQEDGIRVAAQRLAGTAVVGFFCFLVLRWETVARLLLAYPESHCFTVAALILIGRYTGYQLLEPWRFRHAVVMHEPEGHR